MKLRVFLELARISNLPTVWSNAWMGFFAGAVVLGYTQSTRPIQINASDLIPHLPQLLLILVLIALPMSLIYTGGMVLNDYLDRNLDARERPTRPIPSGRINPKTAFWIAVGCLGMGWLGITWFERMYLWPDYKPWRTSAFSGVLIITIVVYNLNHQRSALSVLLMGMCRGLIILTCASTKIPPVQHWSWWVFVALPAATLVLYTIAISIVARREVDPERGGLGGPKTVMNMIAAMPLLDALWLVVMGLWPVSLACVGCAVLTKLGHRRIAGS